MNIDKILEIQPQVVNTESGPEPSLTYMIFHYYWSVGFSAEKSHEATAQYIDKLKVSIIS